MKKFEIKKRTLVNFDKSAEIPSEMTDNVGGGALTYPRYKCESGLEPCYTDYQASCDTCDCNVTYDASCNGTCNTCVASCYGTCNTCVAQTCGCQTQDPDVCFTGRKFTCNYKCPSVLC